MRRRTQYFWFYGSLLLALVLSAQACSSDFSAQGELGSGNPNNQQYLSGNGEPYGGKRSLPIIDIRQLRSLPNLPKHFYRSTRESTCLAEPQRSLELVENLIRDNDGWHHGTEGCELTSLSSSEVDYRRFNATLARYQGDVFTSSFWPHQKNLMLCRAASSSSLQTDVLIQENNVFPDLPQNAALDLNFYIENLDPRLSFSRLSDGSYVDASGVLKIARADEPRFEYLDGEPLGLLVEGPGTNLLTHSEQLEQKGENLLVDQTSSPTEELTAEIASLSSGQNLELVRGTHLSASASQHYTLSVFVKPDAQTEIIRLSLGFGTDTPAQVIYNPKSREITGGKAIWMANGWLRLSLSEKAPSFAAPIAYSVSAKAADPSLVGVWGIQLEKSPFVTSYMASLDVPAIRSGDNLRMEDTSWFGKGEGAFILEWRLQGLVPRTDQHFIVSDDRKLIIEKSTDHQFHVVLDSNKLIVAPHAQGDTFYRSAMSFTNTSVMAVQDGIAREASRKGFSNLGISAISIGQDPQTGEWLFGHIRRIAFWPKILDQGQMIDMTQRSKYSSPYSAIVTIGQVEENSTLERESTLLSVNPVDSSHKAFTSNTYDFSLTINDEGHAFVRALIEGELIERELDCKN